MAGNFDPVIHIYVGEWMARRKVRRLACAERGALVDLWCFQWRDGPIPDSDVPRLAQVIGIEEKALRGVLAAFFEKDPSTGDWLSGRLEDERAEREAIREARRRGADVANAKRSATRERNAKRDAQRVANGVDHAPPSGTDSGTGTGRTDGRTSEAAPPSEERIRTDTLRRTYAPGPGEALATDGRVLNDSLVETFLAAGAEIGEDGVLEFHTGERHDDEPREPCHILEAGYPPTTVPGWLAYGVRVL